MAHEKASNTRGKGQRSLTSFFGGGKGKAKRDEKPLSDDERDQDDSHDHGAESVDQDSDMEIAASNTRKGSSLDASDLPPIHSIPTMFTDLVGRIPQIADVAKHVAGRKLRVATMCSGTESPLLALDLICKSVKEVYHMDLNIEHVFSCEIEPYKQAYIERNFQPPILFRDVCELGQAEAHTAYGALAPVPGDVDMLIAGTSCVDYSNLNNERQDIDGEGESGRTFRGMMSWVKNHRPPLVILENVCSAPWDKVQKYFQENGYSALYTRVDTKHYYIPHTRTRGYLVAVNQRKSGIPDEWKELVTSKLKRHASSTLDAFLLPSDDPRIHQARQKLVQESQNALDRRSGRTDWSRCESRHQRARLEEALGSKRPLTSWDEGGSCKLLDFAWADWGVVQVERVWDLMDISLLRSAKKGIDPSFKTQVWNLSQNVDRTPPGKLGICPCLTPSMIPYITNRGGPLIGLEALSMQGLPVDKLLLTRETEDQLADLAGNAMSTTVVGACMLAALVTGKKLLKSGGDSQSYEVKAGSSAPMDSDAMAIDPSTVSVEEHIISEEQLVQRSLDLSVTDVRSLPPLLVDATKSARLCTCEGRVDMTTRELFRCLDCNTTFCKKCGGRPEHNSQPIDLSTNPRLSPSAFVKELKSVLPMCITISNVTQSLLDGLRDTTGVTIPDSRWSKWSAAVLRAAELELRFVETKRQEIWSAVYASSAAQLDLLLHPKQPEWRLYAKPEPDEPANAEIRKVLDLPVGRLTCHNGLLEGEWEFALPFTASVPIKITGIGELVPAWEARLGLTGDEFRDRCVFSELEITVPEKHASKFDRNISGRYKLLDKCGTANGGLHQKEAIESEKDLPPLYMLLDPHRTTESDDAFVFSISTRRYEYGESRPIISKLDPKWRQSSEKGSKEVTCYIPSHWIPCEYVKLKPSHRQGARFSVPGRNFDVPQAVDACRSALALLVCKVSLCSQAGPEWPLDAWREVDKIHERTVFKALAWLLERIRHVDDQFSSWQNIELVDDLSNCERCAPTAPELKWKQVKSKFIAIENHVQAGEYERSLKRRPSPFVTQLRLDSNGEGTVRVGLNIPTLLHRALSRLPSENRAEKPILFWRLNTSFTSAVTLDRPKFVLLSNKQDKEHAQPPSFIIPLRKEQLRSLEWMIARESKDAPPFIEEEISEAILDPLGWRAEGRAQRAVHVRGGVLADQVGYGKTAITLGLIDCMAKEARKDFDKKGRIPGKIAVHATLIIVPPHLTRQWNSEVRKFTGKRFKVVVISTVSNLNSLTIEDIQSADIVVVASNIFKSNVYLENLQLFAAGGDLPSSDGRHFNAHLDRSLASLRYQANLLQEKGPKAVMDQIEEAQRKAEEEAKQTSAQTKRLKGKSYREAAAAADALAKVSLDSKKSAVPPVAPSGMVVEVVIPKLPSRGASSKSSSGASSVPETSDDDAGENRKRKRVAAAKRIVISSDEEDSEPQTLSSKKGMTSKQTKRKSDVSSEYEDDSAEESATEPDSDFEVTGSSDGGGAQLKANTRLKKQPTKPKPKAKVVQPSKSATSNDETETDCMDVDDDTSKAKKKGGKRKTRDDEEERPTKKRKRQESDPWKLSSAAVRRDWTQMQAPPLEMFHFARKVVDEYTYLEGKVLSIVTRIAADRHWVLSGTPPLHDFAAVKTIAAFLNIHLGVDDDNEGNSIEVKRRRRDQTAVEKFHSFREVHSVEWHAHRHDIGQIFLDQFVRQNIAEIDEIPWTENVLRVNQPAAERAIYLELEHYLRAIDMTIKRNKKSESDREKRLARALGESKTAEEALLKRCSHFELETSNENAMKACDVIVEERQKQLDECKADLLKALQEGVKREKTFKNVGDESMFNEYIRVTREEDEGVGDKEAREIIIELLDNAEARAYKPSKNKGKDEQLDEKTKARIWEHREKTHEIRRLTKELVGRVRSLRYFSVVRDLQKQREMPPSVSCPSCSRKNLPVEEIAVLSSCGHTGCLTCVTQCAEKEECVFAASGACKSAARVLNIVKADTLGIDDEARDGRGKHFGKKLEEIVRLIREDIPKKERMLLFVQFPDLMKKVAEALSTNKIAYLEIKGSASQKSKNLEKFQNESGERVLLLNVMDESASGANLTSANHAIFLSPLLAPTPEIYKACETQAIGRLVRYGQTKHVQVYRFLTTNTIDEEIYEQRRDVMMRDTKV